MRIALLKPPIGGILGLEMLTFVEPLGPECVASALERDGHECRILDLRIDGQERGLAECAAFAPRIVGLQCNFTTERYRCLRIARAVQERIPGAFVVVGGHDASRDPEWFRDPAVDAVAIGDGEEILPALAAELEAGRGPEKAPGLLLRMDDGFRSTGPAPMRMDLDQLAPPARHLIARYAPEYYINFRKPLALLETARGCPYRCNFCSVWQFHDKKFRVKSAERVVEELRRIDAPNVFITDDIFWLDAERGREMARRIQAAGIRKYFTVQTRTDIICRHPDLIELWKGCGDLAIFLGVEKVDDEGLRSLDKRNKASTNVRAIELLKELQVGFTSNFIVDPGWDRADFEQLREWIDRHGAYNSGFSVLTPLPGTLLWEEAKHQVTTADWELYDIIHTVLPTRLPLEEFYAEYARLWRTTLEVRWKHRGRLRSTLQMVGALATGKVTPAALRKGMAIARVFSRPETFLQAHRESPASSSRA